jgi:hypothetical protein
MCRFSAAAATRLLPGCLVQQVSPGSKRPVGAQNIHQQLYTSAAW